MEFFRLGLIKPIQPTTLFEASQIEDAFRYMQKGQHIGKIVVRMPTPAHDLPSTSKIQDLVLRPDVSYLLVGGLGGLGKSVSSWMVEKGAKHLLFLSRSAGESTKDRLFIDELASQKCSVQVFAGSVADLEDVKNVVENAGRPIAGVLQMSMVLRVPTFHWPSPPVNANPSQDSSIAKMTFEDWQTVLLPKVQGTWNLHEALKAEKLDFFVMFSSASGIVGQVGLANYAAANTFLDAFVQYRHRLRLPASVMDIAIVEDVGYVSQHPAILDRARAMGAQIVSEQGLLDALQTTIMLQNDPQQPSPPEITNPNQMVIGLGSRTPITDPQSRCPWKRDVRMSIYRNSDLTAAGSTAGAAAGNESLKGFLAAVAADPAILAAASSLDFLSREIGTRLCGFLQTPVEELDVARSLAVMGVDSLLAIEIRNWWRQALGLEISTLEVLASGNVEGLGKVAAQGLRDRYGAKETEEEEEEEEEEEKERCEMLILNKAP